MKAHEATFIRAIIKDSLIDCTEAEQMVFKKMYSSGNLGLPVAEVVDNMPKNRLIWAMRQVESTLEKVQKI